MRNVDHIADVVIVLEKQEDGYWVTVQGLSGCYSFGTTIDEAISNTREAISEHISDLPEGESIPEIFYSEALDFKIKYDMESLFEKFEMLNKTAIAAKAGINSSLLRQYSKGLAQASNKQQAKIIAAIHEIASDLLQVTV